MLLAFLTSQDGLGWLNNTKIPLSSAKGNSQPLETILNLTHLEKETAYINSGETGFI